MIEKFRKIIDKYFWFIYISFILAIFFVLFLMIKGVMASTTCEFSNPINLGTLEAPDFEFMNSVCSSTDEVLPIENYDVEFNGTTSKLYFSNYWTSGDILIFFSIFCVIIFYIAKTIIGIFVKKFISINRKNQ
jgi:hypothetical protein